MLTVSLLCAPRQSERDGAFPPPHTCDKEQFYRAVKMMPSVLGRGPIALCQMCESGTPPCFGGFLACPRSAGPGLVPGPAAASLPSGHSLFSTEAVSGLWALRSMCSGSGFLHSWVLVFQVCSEVTSLSVFSFLARGRPDLSSFLCSSRHASCSSRLSSAVRFLPQERSASREDRPCICSCSAMNPGAGRGPGTYEADN